MSDSDYLSRCSSYEADIDSENDTISTSSSSSSYSESENNLFTTIKPKPTKKLERKKSNVLLEGYVVDKATKSDDLKRTKSLTDDDLKELKGCVDLGFGFNYQEIPELCNTLPALELCYSMSQKFMDQDHHQHNASSVVVESPIASWKISSPGDNPDDVKARLKFWAQTVACTVRLCT
ncbi:unnamed protein product [Cochlearia groenlandica]